MKATLRTRPHSLIPGAQIYEVWWGSHLIAEVTGADEPGVRVISRYPQQVQQEPGYPNITTVRVGMSRT